MNQSELLAKILEDISLTICASQLAYHMAFTNKDKMASFVFHQLQKKLVDVRAFTKEIQVYIEEC